MRSRLASLVLRASRWTAVGEVPSSGVLVGAPHTSNWDFVMMLLIMWRGGGTPPGLIQKAPLPGPPRADQEGALRRPPPVAAATAGRRPARPRQPGRRGP